MIPLLQALESEPYSIWTREGARHVLHSLIRESVAEEVEPVLEALEDLELCIETSTAAHNALRDLRAGAKQELGG